MTSLNAPCKLSFFLFISSFLLTACGDKPEQAQHAVPEVTVVKVSPKDTPVSAELVAKTQSSRRVEIRSRVVGFLDKREYEEGSMVDVGQVLFQIDPKPFQAELTAAKAELNQQQARMVTAKANLDRIEPLAKQDAVAKKELDDALGNYRSTSASVEAAKAKVVQAELDLGYCTITSPVHGVSSYANLREGAYVGQGPDSLLTYVAQLDPMWVEFSISENQILKHQAEVRKGEMIAPENGNFIVEIVLADGTVFPHKGKITFADASLSEETGTFLIRAEVDNPKKKLRPGMFVRAFLKGGIRPDAILVPQRAVQQGAKGSFVWVINEEGKAEFNPVVVGSWFGDQWFIDSGLKGGETVVVNGALKLRAGVPVKIVDADSKDKKPATVKAQ
ncbi:MAG: efflux RND transporter periplasmic adaptor subunit [Pseudomonadota bacterium]|nr:efflux RND transporter periplasmic adaptor subunit [Pseudomonadota bacterium]